MTLTSKMAAGMTVAAIAVTPMALTPGAAAHAGPSHPQASAPSHSSRAREYGRLCQTESKQHANGHKGTPFSQCVTAMAHLDKGTMTNPTTACTTESRKRLAGQQGTPYSVCVTAGAKLLAAKKHMATATS